MLSFYVRSSRWSSSSTMLLAVTAFILLTNERLSRALSLEVPSRINCFQCDADYNVRIERIQHCQMFNFSDPKKDHVNLESDCTACQLLNGVSRFTRGCLKVENPESKNLNRKCVGEEDCEMICLTNWCNDGKLDNSSKIIMPPSSSAHKCTSHVLPALVSLSLVFGTLMDIMLI